MKKICFLAGNYYKNVTGGAELQMFFLAQEFIRRGYEVHYLTTDVADNKVYNEDNIVIHGVKKGNVESVDKKIKDINPDLLYLRSRNTKLLFYMESAVKSGIPYIYAFATDLHVEKYYTLHDAWQHILKGKLHLLLKLFSSYKEDKLFLEFLDKSIIITTQNHFQYQGAIQLANKHSNIILQRNVFDYDKKITNDKMNSKKTTVAWIANMKPHKRPELFLQLIKLLHNHNTQFYMIGRCDDILLKKKIEKLENEIQNFKYFGQLPQEEVLEILETTDVLLNTTKPGLEGFPNSYIQAWMNFVPVVALDVDPDNLILDNHLGFFADSSFEQMVLKTKILIENDSLRKELSINAHEFASNNFTTKNYTEMFELLSSKSLITRKHKEKK